MKRVVYFLVSLSFLVGCHETGAKGKKDSTQEKSIAEMIQDQAEVYVQNKEASKRKLDDLSHDELIQLTTNPKEEDRELLNEYIYQTDIDPFVFPPLKDDEKLTLKKVYHNYFKDSDNSISTNELIVYKEVDTSSSIEIKRFNRAGYIVADTNEVPDCLFFYINDSRDRSGLNLWKIDGKKGTADIILSEGGYKEVSPDGNLLFADQDSYHELNGSNYAFPKIVIYSVSQGKVIKEFDLYNSLLTELDNGAIMEEAFGYVFFNESNYVIAELRFMGNPKFKFTINLTSLEIHRL